MPRVCVKYRSVKFSKLFMNKKMLHILTLALVLTFNAFATEAVEVISAHDVDPAKVDYKNATTVLLKNIQIREIPKHYFRNLGLDLSLLRITNSKLLRIDEEAFDGLDHLNLLELSNDEITKIEPKTFYRLKGLELLQLKSNKLRELSLVLNHVQEIVLSHNEIEYLQENFITGDSITFVDLKSNLLHSLEHSMKSLSKLATIYIANNRITDIKPEVFADNENLVRVYASGNLLTSTNGLKLEQLKTLDVSSNRLSHLDNDSFTGMSFLDELLLNSNQITDIDNAFSETKNLQFLDLSDNLLSEISPDMFANNPYLSKLRLAKNKLRTLTPFTNNLRHLRVLDLSHNHLEVIDPKFFEPIIKLEILDLSFNKLTKIGSMLSPLTNLVNLDLSSNKIEFDRNTTRSNVKLNQLNLSSNALDLGLSYFAKNSQLRILDLSKNNISNLCDVELNLDSLVTIDLSHNRMKELNCFKNNNLLPFAVIDIRHNPWTCDSNFDDVIANFILMESTPFIVQSYNIMDVHSEIHNLKNSHDMWNSVKREICPNGLNIYIKRVSHELEDEEKDGQELKDDDQYWYFEYYDSLSSSDDKIRREGTEAPDKDLKFSIKINTKNIPEIIEGVHEQSERGSWEKISQNQFHLIKSQFSLFTISLICIGVSLILILINVVVFMFIRMRGWKKDFRGAQKYTHLENKVYRETTVPNDYSTLGENKNYKINCTRMFTNLGFKTNEDDTESVKKMIIENGVKSEV